MKHQYTLALGCAIITSVAHGSTCTTVADGNFLDPSVWNCGCDPLQCDTLVVTHQMTLALDIIVPNDLYVLAEGSIVGPSALHCQGSLTNSGSLDLSRLSAEYPCELFNEGYLSVDTLDVVTSSFSNVGTIMSADSMNVFGAFSIMNTGYITGPSIRIGPHWPNHGSVTCIRLYSGSFENFGSITCASLGYAMNPVYNYGSMHVDSLAIEQILENGETGSVTCNSLVLTGALENHGNLSVLGLLLNGTLEDDGDLQMHPNSSTDVRNIINTLGSILRGPGTLCIAEHSENHGVVSGPIGICDITPTSTIPPYMDVHDGTLSIPIYGCGPTDCTSVGVAEIATATQPLIFPQPVNGSFTIDLGESATGMASMCLFDPIGKVIQTMVGPFGPQVRVDVQEGPSGICLLQGFDDKGRQVFATRVTLID